MKAHFKALISVLVILVFGFGGFFFFKKAKAPESQSSSAIVNPQTLKLPSTDLLLVNNKTLSAAEFKNKIVIVNFWASWCAPCIEEVPSLIQLTKKNKQILILAISGDTNTEDIFAFMKSFPEFNKAPFYQVWGDNKKLLEQFNVVKLPESYIFNSKGEMVKRISGTINWDTPDSEEYFKSL